MTALYFPVALNLAGQRALVIGGDHEAADKAGRLAAAGARVDVVWPDAGSALRRVALRSGVHWYVREFTLADTRGCRIVVLCPHDPGLAARLRSLGRKEGFWLCAIDQPAFCDWVNLGTVQRGPITVAFSSGGTAPALVGRLREALAEGLDGRFATFAERLGRYRQQIRDLGREERRRVLGRALSGFEVEVRVRYPGWEADPDTEPPA